MGYCGQAKNGHSHDVDILNQCLKVPVGDYFLESKVIVPRQQSMVHDSLASKNEGMGLVLKEDRLIELVIKEGENVSLVSNNSMITNADCNDDVFDFCQVKVYLSQGIQFDFFQKDWFHLSKTNSRSMVGYFKKTIEIYDEKWIFGSEFIHKCFLYMISHQLTYIIFLSLLVFQEHTSLFHSGSYFSQPVNGFTWAT